MDYVAAELNSNADSLKQNEDGSSELDA